ncbi:hypothetical protein ANN_10391 [Periplaneta americana]|uniref:Per a allergen n=1 Tax=Periplaneta americana TaxID=6978 RepID=A0ABQ8TNZ3_PERAM|nr:hypothetical protein ANN_10391 [Periplaneta americana]
MPVRMEDWLELKELKKNQELPSILEAVSSIRNLRTRHAVVIRTPTIHGMNMNNVINANYKFIEINERE